MHVDAKSKKLSKVKIVGANRPSDLRIEDDLMINLGLMLDAFAEQEGRRAGQYQIRPNRSRRRRAL